MAGQLSTCRQRVRIGVTLIGIGNVRAIVGAVVDAVIVRVGGVFGLAVAEQPSAPHGIPVVASFARIDGAVAAYRNGGVRTRAQYSVSSTSCAAIVRYPKLPTITPDRPASGPRFTRLTLVEDSSVIEPSERSESQGGPNAHLPRGTRLDANIGVPPPLS